MKTILATIALSLLLGGSALAAPNITLATDTTTCGQVSVTASGYGIQEGVTYQLVADKAVRFAVGHSGVAQATFPLSEAGEWGNVAVRTVYGGYLAATTTLGPGLAWYHISACQ